jgi:molybdopterin converting factor small subunit
VKVCIPTPLRSYTRNEKWVQSHGATLNDMLCDLDAQFPGIRFRVVDEQGRLRKHMKIFVNQEVVRDLTSTITDADEVTIMQALSGGAC